MLEMTTCSNMFYVRTRTTAATTTTTTAIKKHNQQIAKQNVDTNPFFITQLQTRHVFQWQIKREINLKKLHKN